MGRGWSVCQSVGLSCSARSPARPPVGSFKSSQVFSVWWLAGLGRRSQAKDEHLLSLRRRVAFSSGVRASAGG